MRTIALPFLHSLPWPTFDGTVWRVVWYDAQQRIWLWFEGATGLLELGAGVNPAASGTAVTWRSAAHDWDQVLREADGTLHRLPFGPAGGVQSGVIGSGRVAWTSVVPNSGSLQNVYVAPLPYSPQQVQFIRNTLASEGLAYVDPAGGIIDQDEARTAQPGMTRSFEAEDGTLIGEHPDSGVLIRRAGCADLRLWAGRSTGWPRIAWNRKSGADAQWGVVAHGQTELLVLEPSDFACVEPPPAKPQVTISDPPIEAWPVTTVLEPGQEFGTLQCELASTGGPVDVVTWEVREADTGQLVESFTGNLQTVAIIDFEAEPGVYRISLLATGPGGDDATTRVREWIVEAAPVLPKPPVPDNVKTETRFEWIPEMAEFYGRNFDPDLEGDDPGYFRGLNDGMFFMQRVFDVGWRPADEQMGKDAGLGDPPPPEVLFFAYPDEPEPPEPPPPDPRYGTIQVQVVHPTPGLGDFAGVYDFWGSRYRTVVDGARSNLYLGRPWSSLEAQIAAAYAKAGKQPVWILDTAVAGRGFPIWTSADRDKAALVVDFLHQQTGGRVNIELGNEVWTAADFPRMRDAAQALFPGRPWLHIGISADPWDWNPGGPLRTVDLVGLRNFFDDDGRLHPVFHVYTIGSPRTARATIAQVMAQFYPGAKGRPWMTEAGWQESVTTRSLYYPQLIRVCAESDCELVCLYAYTGDEHSLWNLDGSDTPAIAAVRDFLASVRAPTTAPPLSNPSLGSALYVLLKDRGAL